MLIAFLNLKSCLTSPCSGYCGGKATITSDLQDSVTAEVNKRGATATIYVIGPHVAFPTKHQLLAR
jgi:hypothetical protein